MTRHLLSRTALVLVALAAAGQAPAGGTPSGTTVENTISLSYDSGGDTISDPTASTDSFNVDERLDFSLVGQDTPPDLTVEPTENSQTLTFLLTNEGNDPRDFDIDLAQTAGPDGAIGLTFDATGSGAAGTYSVYTSPNPTGGPDTLYDPAGVDGVGSLAADGELYVKIVAHIPETASQDEQDVFTLTAQPLNGAGTGIQSESTSFGDGSTEVVYGDGGTDGTEDDTESYLVQSALISATKTVTVASENRDGGFDCANDTDESGAAAFVPGGCINYTITLTNDAAAGVAASNFTFTDALPGEISFVTIFTDTGFDTVSESSGTVTGTVNSLAPGSSATAVIRATID